MARMGMDVERVEVAANSLKAQAGQLELLTRNLDNIVKSTLTRWEGPDAAHFVNEAWPGYRSGLNAALEHIRGLIQSMRNNVEEQRKGSEKDGGGSLHPDGGSLPGTVPSPLIGPQGLQNYKVSNAISIAKSEVGRHGGQCVIAVEHWINAAGGNFVGGGAVSGYVKSHAIPVAPSEVQPGDVIQYTSLANPDAWDTGPDGLHGVHTVMVTAVHPDGSLDIVQSNAWWVNNHRVAPETVSEEANWHPAPPAGFEARYWRFGQQ